MTSHVISVDKLPRNFRSLIIMIFLGIRPANSHSLAVSGSAPAIFAIFTSDNPKSIRLALILSPKVIITSSHLTAVYRLFAGRNRYSENFY
jgi:hypothetical protein